MTSPASASSNFITSRSCSGGSEGSSNQRLAASSAATTSRLSSKVWISANESRVPPGAPAEAGGFGVAVGAGGLAPNPPAEPTDGVGIAGKLAEARWMSPEADRPLLAAGKGVVPTERDEARGVATPPSNGAGW